jgi:hypothetical protein
MRNYKPPFCHLISIHTTMQPGRRNMQRRYHMLESLIAPDHWWRKAGAIAVLFYRSFQPFACAVANRGTSEIEDDEGRLKEMLLRTLKGSVS